MENYLSNPLVVVGGIVVVLLLISFVFTYFLKLAIGIGIVAFLFMVIYVWGPVDLQEKLHLDKILSPKDSNKIQEVYGDYAKTRDENMIIDTKAIADNVGQLTKEYKDKLIADLKSLDKEEINQKIAELKAKMKEEDWKIFYDENKEWIEEKKK